MKFLAVIGTATVFLAFSTASGFAQGEEHPRQEEHPQAQHPEARPEHPQAQHPQAEHPPAQHPQPQREAPKQDNHAQQEQQKRAQDNQHHAQQEAQQHARETQQHQAQQDHRQVEQNAKAQADQRRIQQERARQAHDNRSHPSDHNHPEGRPAAYHGRIPEQNFHAHFGREHHFRFHRPEIYQGHPRFQYGGYWFQYVEPWPVGWSYDDDVYVDYVDDQYYLFDPVHPGARLVINVIL